ncbi:MAG: UDP-N-acetylmuramoyl-tripeptide--D-alanyl-D-alanine ligase [Paludibacteraceae bacterium]
MVSLSELYKLFCEHSQVTTDSRVCPEGSLFFALKGDNFDGNRFAQAALDKGCAYAVVDEPEFATNDRILLVDNVLNTLQQLARMHREWLGIPIVGITGTNGKTTTKELVAAVLKEKFNVHYTQGNFNNHIGVPLTLLQLSDKHDVAVIEMGASHLGEIAELVEIVRPDCGLITNVGKAHLAGFGSLAGVLQTKGALYNYLREHKGKVFINAKNDLLQSISHGLNATSYALDIEADVQGTVVDCSPFVVLKWQRKGGVEHIVKTNFVGIYNAENMLAAITVGLHFGVAEPDICHALATYVPHNNRSQFVETAHNRLVVDAYNANPTSMMAALENFVAMQLPHKVAILGDMLELGAQSRDEHRKIIQFVTACGFDLVLLVGEQFAQVADDTCLTFDNVACLSEFLQNHPLTDNTILVKGSNGIHLTNIVPLL